MEVRAVCDERAFPTAHATDRGDDQVEDGHENDGQRQDEGQRGHNHLLAAQQRRIDLAGDNDAGAGQDESHGLRSPAHHDRGWVEVKPEEARAHAEQRDHDEACSRRVGSRSHQSGDDVGVDEERSRADRNHARCQAVETVNKVDGVHDADDEEDGDEEPQARGTERDTEDREGRELDASEGHTAGDQHLAAELSHPVQFDNVVNDAEDAHGGGAGHDGPWDCCRKQGRHVGDA